MVSAEEPVADASQPRQRIATDASQPRQRIVRARTGRRAKLTPAPNTMPEPTHAEAVGDEPDAPPAAGAPGPNDQQLRQDVPPHY